MAPQGEAGLPAVMAHLRRFVDGPYGQTDASEAHVRDALGSRKAEAIRATVSRLRPAQRQRRARDVLAATWADHGGDWLLFEDPEKKGAWAKRWVVVGAGTLQIFEDPRQVMHCSSSALGGADLRQLGAAVTRIAPAQPRGGPRQAKDGGEGISRIPLDVCSLRVAPKTVRPC